MKQKYSFCVDQLERLHEIVPSYEDSKELESYCHQAILLEKEQLAKENEEKKRQEAQARIQTIIDNCEAGKNESTTSADLQICLQPALELNPDEPRAQALISELEQKEASAAQAAESAAANAARKSAGMAAYQAAVRLEKQGKFKSAKSQYYKFLRGGYGLFNEEKKARRSIASIDKKLDAKVMASVGKCESFLKQGKYKDAIKNCNTALKIDSENTRAVQAKRSVEKKLRVEMKKIWDQSVLEENFGNIEAAKSKWREISEKSVPGEEFYKRAKRKLKSYGIE